MAARRTGLLMNLGPATERQLAEIGIVDEGGLRALGAIEAWRRLKFRFPREMNAVGLYALEGALRDCHWNALPPEVKAALKAEADATSVRLRKGRDQIPEISMSMAEITS